jgi:DNA (cytosine-5)-methyltransferase 1
VKPAYVIPPMRDVERMPLNGVRVVSLFSGCGGSSLGYRMAGCKVVYANEFILSARESYAANFPDVPIDPRDVREVAGEDILSVTGLEMGELDILDGSPPCASFSSAGDRNQGWGKVKAYSETKQRTDDLFDHYVRLVDQLRPRRFIAENVAGLVRGVGKGWFLSILAALKACGYDVEARVLDAQWLGVPQARERLFFVGVRKDLASRPAWPLPLPYRYSVRDALPEVAGLDHANGWNGHAMQPASLPARTVQANRTVRATIRFGNKANFTQKGQAIRWDRPMPTVMGGDTLGLASWQFEVEQNGRRRLTIDELRRLCGFPADFILTGSYAQQWERLGRAVPPPVMAALVRANIDGEAATERQDEQRDIPEPRTGNRLRPLHGPPPAFLVGAG